MRPADEQQLAEAVANATGPLRIKGGGTRAGLGHPVEGAVLETSGLSGISLYEPGALTLVVKAGTPMAEVETALDAENQRLPFEPMDHRSLFGSEGSPTIGAVAACNISGPRRIQAGACRDCMLGVRFVDGQGNVIKNGGRVMKNVTGYDLVKLLAGSYGTLGVLTEVAFKVLPKPEVSRTIVLRGLSDAQAGAAMRAALASPFDVTGAAHDPKPGHEATFIRIEGFAQSVTYRATQLEEMLAAFTDQIDSDGDVRTWDAIRDASGLQGEGDVWRISVKPTDGPAVVEQLRPLAHCYDWGGGLVWVRVAAGSDVRAALNGIGGHATLLRASDETKTRLGVFQPVDRVTAALSAGLREKFDPRGVLNPGLMYPQ
ncbi:glycolate oxidase subunit GlcE [Halovulum sp. GXIMD14793]